MRRYLILGLVASLVVLGSGCAFVANLTAGLQQGGLNDILSLVINAAVNSFANKFLGTPGP